MIKSFSVLYVGHIALENVGRDGTPADEHGRPWGTPGAPTGVPTIEEGVRQKAWLVGPPISVISRLRELEFEYPGLEQIVLHWPEGMPADEWKTQLGLFAREVMPAFQLQPAAVP
jgi:hypothetical protein